MAKLHELLAVENDLRGQAETCRADLKKTFESKGHHFTKKLTTFKPTKEGIPEKMEEQLALQTTVRKELGWIGDKIAKAMDLGHQVDMANTTAKADVVLDDGTVLLKDMPATSLLRLEHRIAEVKELAASVGTLDPSKGFALDPTEGEGIYRARDIEGFRTEKQFKFVVMVPPSDRHPAQVKELMTDEPIGTLLKQEWSSLITVADKGDMLDRIEELSRAVKKARARANEIDIDVRQNKIGDAVIGYMLNGTK